MLRILGNSTISLVKTVKFFRQNYLLFTVTFPLLSGNLKLNMSNVTNSVDFGIQVNITIFVSI